LLIALAIGGFDFRLAGRAIIGILVVIFAFTRPPYWGRLPAYGTEFLHVELPPVNNLDRATVVLAEDEPLAFLALGFPPSTTFVRIGGNLMGPPNPAYGMDREAARRLSSAHGPLFALLANPKSRRALAALKRQQLRLVPPCRDVESNLLGTTDRVYLCSLQRVSTNPSSALTPAMATRD